MRKKDDILTERKKKVSDVESIELVIDIRDALTEISETLKDINKHIKSK